MLTLLADDTTWETPEPGRASRDAVNPLCARYLTETEPGRGQRDPVARFHLGNGARLERINWRGNVSPRGLQEFPYGLMVNYLYDPDTIEANHEAFATGGEGRAFGGSRRALAAPRTPTLWAAPTRRITSADLGQERLRTGANNCRGQKTSMAATPMPPAARGYQRGDRSTRASSGRPRTPPGRF